MEWVIGYFLIGWIILTAIENVPDDVLVKWFHFTPDTPERKAFFLELLGLVCWLPMISFVLPICFRWNRLGMISIFKKINRLTLFPKFRNK